MHRKRWESCCRFHQVEEKWKIILLPTPSFVSLIIRYAIQSRDSVHLHLTRTKSRRRDISLFAACVRRMEKTRRTLEVAWQIKFVKMVFDENIVLTIWWKTNIKQNWTKGFVEKTAHRPPGKNIYFFRCQSTTQARKGRRKTNHANVDKFTLRILGSRNSDKKSEQVR